MRPHNQFAAFKLLKPLKRLTTPRCRLFRSGESPQKLLRHLLFFSVAHFFKHWKKNYRDINHLPYYSQCYDVRFWTLLFMSQSRVSHSLSSILRIIKQDFGLVVPPQEAGASPTLSPIRQQQQQQQQQQQHSENTSVFDLAMTLTRTTHEDLRVSNSTPRASPNSPAGSTSRRNFFRHSSWGQQYNRQTLMSSKYTCICNTKLFWEKLKRNEFESQPSKKVSRDSRLTE